MQLTNDQKQDLVTKIKGSNTFKNAPTSIALLQYLHDATLKGTHLKEGVIDIEFFGSKESPDKGNPRVRVNVYNLRKKLTSYFEKEGKDNGWRLIIEKGQYEVSFIKEQSRRRFFKKLSWMTLLPYFALLLSIFIIVITNTPPKSPKIWRPFLSRNNPTNLFIGDVFGAIGKTITHGNGWTRDFRINSVTEFYDLVEREPGLKNVVHPSTFTYATGMAAISTQKFQQFYQHHNREFSIRFITRTSISEIKEGNAIYVGPFRNNNQFIHFFNEANPYCKITDSALHLSNHPFIKDASFSISSTNQLEEYAIVSKYPGSGSTEHFVFLSQHDIGVSATVEYFTNPDSIQNFANAYLQDKDYFTAIFKVKGQNRTNTDLKLELVVSF